MCGFLGRGVGLEFLRNSRGWREVRDSSVRGGEVCGYCGGFGGSFFLGAWVKIVVEDR